MVNLLSELEAISDNARSDASHLYIDGHLKPVWRSGRIYARLIESYSPCSLLQLSEDLFLNLFNHHFWGSDLVTSYKSQEEFTPRYTMQIKANINAK